MIADLIEELVREASNRDPFYTWRRTLRIREIKEALNAELNKVGGPTEAPSPSPLVPPPQTS